MTKVSLCNQLAQGSLPIQIPFGSGLQFSTTWWQLPTLVSISMSLVEQGRAEAARAAAPVPGIPWLGGIHFDVHMESEYYWGKGNLPSVSPLPEMVLSAVSQLTCYQASYRIRANLSNIIMHFKGFFFFKEQKLKNRDNTKVRVVMWTIWK